MIWWGNFCTKILIESNELKYTRLSFSTDVLCSPASLSVWDAETVSKHVAKVFRTQQWAMQGHDSWHLLNGENRQGNGGAVTEKAGYTLHCVARTVTLQDACEMGLRWPRVSAKNLKSIWSFGAQMNLCCKSLPFHIHALLDSFWTLCTEWAVIFSTYPKSHNLLKCIYF